jgi:ParB family chromosome partitioning protein
MFDIAVRPVDVGLDAQLARRLDPRRVDIGAYANRDPSHYHGEAWEAFQREIAASNGNVQAVLVHPKEAGRFEIVFGHRRRQACSDEALPLLAVIAKGIGDQLLFQLMERKNRSRVDLSPYEQGQTYTTALDRGLYASLRQLAAAIDRDPGIVSRYLAIARLPAPVLDALSSRTNVQKRWGEQLAALHQKDPDGLLARARTLSSLRKRPSDAEVFRQLCDAPSPPSFSPVVVKDAGGKEVATVRHRGASSVEITLKDAALTDEQVQKLLDVLVGPS